MMGPGWGMPTEAICVPVSGILSGQLWDSGRCCTQLPAFLVSFHCQLLRLTPTKGPVQNRLQFISFVVKAHSKCIFLVYSWLMNYGLCEKPGKVWDTCFELAGPVQGAQRGLMTWSQLRQTQSSCVYPCPFAPRNRSGQGPGKMEAHHLNNLSVVGRPAVQLAADIGRVFDTESLASGPGWWLALMPSEQPRGQAVRGRRNL